MSVATLSQSASTSVFPTTEVETGLRKELLEAVKSAASLKGISLSTDPMAQAIDIDSLVVVALLCEIDPIVGFELKESVVRAGGYHSINEAVDHLMPGVQKAWQKHTSKGVKK